MPLQGWVNHFLLGLGVAQPKLSEHKELTEVITDLRNIGALGYEEDENQRKSLEDALEEVTEYVKSLCSAVLYHFCRLKKRQQQKMINKMNNGHYINNCLINWRITKRSIKG